MFDSAATIKSDWRARERLRKRYRPSPVRILFVGESPPASGRFFYQDFTVLLQTHLRLRFHRCRKANFLTPFVRLVAISWVFAVSQWITRPDVLASVFAVPGKFVSREPFENVIRRPWSPLLDQSGQM